MKPRFCYSSISLDLRKLTLIFLLSSSFSLGFAKNGDGGKSSGNHNKAMASGCLNPEASAVLELNNVRALIHSGGDMWWDLQNYARYEIPKGSGVSSLFLGSLWMGGKDINGQLKIAAQMFRSNGPDFYTGPLNLDDASITAETCKEYDRLWKISRAEVAEFRNCPVPCPQSKVPEVIQHWPATDGYSLNTDSSYQYYSAPFIDVNDDGEYNWEDGDYPAYDLDNKADCQKDRTPYLYGDETIFWIFNDKGNIHYETGTDKPIGLEVRAQAFAFATNDEINNMTFYNYEIINRGSTDLYDCYFGVNTDADLGYAPDDYVGCDVMRGFGYIYNSDLIDGPSNTIQPACYGPNPPAIGIDFFEGPYADKNGVDDAFDSSDVSTWLAINGVGYGDGIEDNERIGMRRFIYYENSTDAVRGPHVGNAGEFYFLLDGRWTNGSRMVFGGKGFADSQGATQLEADFMFPGDSDPLNWGTKGVNPNFEWTQKNPCPSCPEAAGGDRRFVQSAGPFTLKAGAVNDITTGAVWARSYSGDPFESVKLVRKADDKAQLLFENCFRVLNGPDAPTVTIQELDRELLLYWTNDKLSNNKNNAYEELDYSLSPLLVPDEEKRKYRFQGYLVYQVANEYVTAEERHDLDKARLVAQSDLRDFNSVGNPIRTLINYGSDGMPVVEVQGANEGVKHSVRILEDAFAMGSDKRLVNHKDYHFMVIAYAYNEYKKYDPNDAGALDGQKKPFIASRRSGDGKAIRVTTGVPHIPAPESYGTLLNTFYGDGPEITRIEGNGNGGNVLELTAESESSILQFPYFNDEITYKKSRGPVSIKVVDPLAVKKGIYYIQFEGPVKVSGSGNLNTMEVQGTWNLLNEDMQVIARSNNDLTVNTEKLLFDTLTNEFIGLSVVINQVKQPGNDLEANNGFMETSMQVENPAETYLGFIPDNDIVPALNWILSGTQEGNMAPGILPDIPNLDNSQAFERATIGSGGSLAPYMLTSNGTNGPHWSQNISSGLQTIAQLQSVDLVLTPDQSKWTRVPIFEMCEDKTLSYFHPDLNRSASKFDLRRSPSVDKNGRYATEDGTIIGKILTGTSNDPEDANYISEWGMGWFPGYAISLETGERLNMAFGEDSYLALSNGRDMLFNPTGIDPYNLGSYSEVLADLGDPILGGKHFIYIFAHTKAFGNSFDETPRYDASAWAMEKLLGAELATDNNNGAEAVRLKTNVMRAAMWTGMPVSLIGRSWLSKELRVRMRVAKPYMQFSNYALNEPTVLQNDSKPLYKFSLDGLFPQINESDVARSALDLINVVPNPYYAYSAYENTQLDNTVKITNLPPECTVTIYNVAGSLIRRYTKGDNVSTSLNWDLTNFANIPIASGIYIIHVHVPGMGDRVIKWFGVLRPTDLSDF